MDNNVFLSASVSSPSPPSSLPRMSVELEELLHQWATCWAKEKNKSLDWVALDAATLSEKCKANSFYRKEKVNWLQLKPIMAKDIMSAAEPSIVERRVTLKEILQTSPHNNYFANAVYPLNVLLRKALATSHTLSCSSEITYNAGLEMSDELPYMDSFKTTLELALKKGKAESKREKEQQEELITQIVNMQAGKHTSVDTILIESITTQEWTYKLTLQGGIIIGCKEKVAHEDKTHHRQGEHRRWYVPIQDILRDIARYSINENVPDNLRHFFRQAVSRVTVTEQAVCFQLQTQVVVKTYISPNVHSQETQLPCISPTGSSDVNKSAANHSSQTNMVAIFSAIADKPQASANVETDGLPADELNKIIMTTAKAASRAELFSQSSGSRIFSIGSAHATEQGATARAAIRFKCASVISAVSKDEEEENDKRGIISESAIATGQNSSAKVEKHNYYHYHSHYEVPASYSAEASSKQTNEIDLQNSELQSCLQKRYQLFNSLESLFDETTTDISQSFISIALVTEQERKQKEDNLKNDNHSSMQQTEFKDQRLASHEALYVIEKPLELTKLFTHNEDNEPPRKILVLGRAGIGKSVLCQYLATQWAHAVKASAQISASANISSDPFIAAPQSSLSSAVGRSLAQKFQAIFWLKLRDVAEEKCNDTGLAATLIHFCCGDIEQDNPSIDQLKAYLAAHRHEVLFILDGYDEVSDKLTQQKQVYSHLLNTLNEIAKYPYVLLTSRPANITHLGSTPIRFDRKTETIGFTNKNIKDFTYRFMAETQAIKSKSPTDRKQKADKLIKILKANLSVWGIAHIPINLELLCFLWAKGQLGFSEADKLTLSKLYEKVVKQVSNKLHAKVSPQESSVQFQDSKIRSDNDQEIVTYFLETLAFHAMAKTSLLLEDELLTRSIDETLNKNCYSTTTQNQQSLLAMASNKIGFLRPTGGGKSSLDQTYYFIHLSFQEFFAASYIKRHLTHDLTSKTSSELLNTVRQQKHEPRYQLTLWLTAGLLYQYGKKSSPTSFLPLLHFWHALLSQPRDITGRQLIPLLMHCMNECEGDESLPWQQEFFNGLKDIFNLISEGNYRTIMNAWRYSHFLHTPLMQQYFIELLEKMQNPDTLIELLSYIEKPIPQVRLPLLNELLNEYHFDSVNCTGMEDNIIKTLSNLGNHHPEFVSEMLQIAEDKNNDSVRRISAILAIKKLSNPNHEHVSTLIRFAKDNSNNINFRIFAISELTTNNISYKYSSEIAAAMVELAKNENEDISHAAIIALEVGNFSIAVVPILITAFNDKELQKLDVRSYKSNILKKLGKFINTSQEAFKSLFSIIKDKNEIAKIRSKAIEEFCKLAFPNSEVFSTLLKIAKERNWTCKLAAIEALVKFSYCSQEFIELLLNIAQPNLADKPSSLAISILGHLASSNQKALKKLLKMTRSDNEINRGIAIHSLCHQNSTLPNHDVTTILLTAIKDELNHPNVRRELVIKALGKLANPSKDVIAVLLKAANNENGVVRYNAIKALGNHKRTDSNIINAIFIAATDKDFIIKQPSFLALARITNTYPAATKILLDSANDKIEQFKYWAIEALCQIPNPNPEIITILLDTAQNCKDVQLSIMAIKALRNIASPSQKVIKALLAIITSKNGNFLFGEIEARSILYQYPIQLVFYLISENENIIEEYFPLFWEGCNYSAIHQDTLIISMNDNLHFSSSKINTQQNDIFLTRLKKYCPDYCLIQDISDKLFNQANSILTGANMLSANSQNNLEQTAVVQQPQGQATPAQQLAAIPSPAALSTAQMMQALRPQAPSSIIMTGTDEHSVVHGSSTINQVGFQSVHHFAMANQAQATRDFYNQSGVIHNHHYVYSSGQSSSASAAMPAAAMTATQPAVASAKGVKAGRHIINQASQGNMADISRAVAQKNVYNRATQGGQAIADEAEAGEYFYNYAGSSPKP